MKATSAEKRIVEQLDFGPKTAKRVGWESFEFTVTGPHRVRVTNAAYSAEKEDHAYEVRITDTDDGPRPVECECPADTHHEQDCKHKLALSTIGGPTVLRAALSVAGPTAGPSSDSERCDRQVKADGGTVQTTEANACPNGDPRCDEPDGDGLPCFECYTPSEGGR